MIDCKTVRIFVHSSTREQSNERSGTRLKTVSENGRDAKSFFSLASRACETRKTLTPRFTDFFTDFDFDFDFGIKTYLYENYSQKKGSRKF